LGSPGLVSAARRGWREHLDVSKNEEMAMAVITIARSFSSLLPSLGVARKWSSQYKAGKSVSWALKCEGREVCEAKSVGIEAGIRAGYQQRQQEEGADSGPVTVEKETSAAMFVDASHQIAFNPSRMHYGVCVADLNNDGKMEFFVCGFADQNQLLKWTGTELVNIANGTPLEDPSSSSIGVAAGDFDGDGSEELYVLNTDTFLGRKKVTDRLFDHQEGRWVDLFALPRNMDDSNMCAGRSVCAVDRMGTGKSVLLHNSFLYFSLLDLPDSKPLLSFLNVMVSELFF
jgi:hypothetical protein